MIYRFIIPWILIIGIVAFIAIVVTGIVIASTKRRRSESLREGGRDSNSHHIDNSGSYSSGGAPINTVPRNFCPYCGIRLYQGSSYCANCGRTVEGLAK